MITKLLRTLRSVPAETPSHHAPAQAGVGRTAAANSPSLFGAPIVVGRVAALIGRLPLPGRARADAEADPLEDLWDPVGVPDPITIALGRGAR